jgi:hypothetical protein
MIKRNISSPSRKKVKAIRFLISFLKNTMPPYKKG